MCKQLYVAVRIFLCAKLLVLLLLCAAVPLQAQTPSQNESNQAHEAHAQNEGARAVDDAQSETNETQHTDGAQFGADGTQQEVDSALQGAEMRETEGDKKSKRRVDFMIAFGPAFLFNKEAKTKSAPSPVVFPLSFGISVPNDTLVSFQPRLLFFVNYYLWDNSAQLALPAEIENRTATALSFLITLPAAFSFHVSRNSVLEVQAGLSVLMRFAILAHGISAGDSGTSGNAKSDVKHISRWFWGNARWLYIDTEIAWLYRFSNGVKIGPEARFYLPLGSLFSGRGIDAFMVSAGIKIAL